MTRALILGGARSGKSAYSEELIAKCAPTARPIRYIATAPRRADDREWEARIAEHVQRRPTDWHTVETLDVAAELRRVPHLPTLIDDVGTWLMGHIDRQNAWDSPPDAFEGMCDELVSAVDAYEGPLVLVTPEVGMGIVPATPAGRMFRDAIGVLNGRLAEKCEKVVLVIAGIPLSLKEIRTRT